MLNFNNLFPTKNKHMTKEELATFLKTNPDMLSKFEKAYKIADMEFDEQTGYVNAKTASNKIISNEYDDSFADDIVDELYAKTKIWSYIRKDNKPAVTTLQNNSLNYESKFTIKELNKLPIENRPMLTGNAAVRHISEDSYPYLLEDLKRFQTHPDPKIRKASYQQFRRGLDVLDLDPIVYEMLSCNLNSMGYWLPEMIDAIEYEGFFKIPNTTIVKVPLPILQLSRMDYCNLNRITLDIIDKWAQKAFNLNTDNKYFIKTGTYSSKFDFRNACVTEPKEILEIGEYLLYIQNSAISPYFYGMSTTNEWVVREFIEDEENEKFTIYHGLPLHTEYRVFVDFDTDEVLGIHNYWDPDVMLKRFGDSEDSNNPNMIHDYVTFTAQADKITQRFNENKELVLNHIKTLLPYVNLTGQWSIDIMQNNDSFWFIDMALAESSAFYEQEVPIEKRVPTKENWIPMLNI